MVYEVETNRKFFRDAKDWNCLNMHTLQLKYVHISTVNELKLVCVSFSHFQNSKTFQRGFKKLVYIVPYIFGLFTKLP